MALGALGIIGALGKGYRMGVEDVERRKAADQQAKLRDYQLRAAKRDADMQDEIAQATGTLSSDADAAQSASQTRAAGINGAVAQGAANSAMAQDMGNAIKSGISDGVQKLMGPQSATPALAALGQTPQLGPQSPDATGIAAGSNRVADLSNTNPRTSPQGTAAGMTKDQAAATAWKQKAPELANIYRKYGRVAEADAIMKSADSQEAQMYDRQLTSAMRDYYGGNLDAAAGKLSALYNLSYNDGKFVDVQSVGKGQFQVTQYDEKTGKTLGSQVIGPQEIEQLMRTTLSTPERVKLMSQEMISKRAADTQNSITARYLAGQAGQDRRLDKTESGKDTRSAADRASREKVAGGHDATSERNNIRTNERAEGNNIRTNDTRERNVDVQEAGKDERQDKAETGRNERSKEREAGKDRRAPGIAAQFKKPAPAAAQDKPLPLPKTKADLVAGKVYDTARGPATWNGTAFTPVK